MSEKYKTCKRINFATDQWGNEEGVTHIELQFGGQSWFIDFECDETGQDTKMIICGFMQDVQQTAGNVVEITPWIRKEKKS